MPYENRKLEYTSIAVGREIRTYKYYNILNQTNGISKATVCVSARLTNVHGMELIFRI